MEATKLIAYAAILQNLLDLLNSAQVHCRSVNQMRVCNKYICFMFQIDIVYKYIGKRVNTMLKIKKMVKRMGLEHFAHLTSQLNGFYKDHMKQGPGKNDI